MLLYDLEFYYKSQKKPSIGVLRKRCFPVNVLYIFRTPFPKNTSGGLFLKSVASKNLNEERILEINYHIRFFVFCFLLFFWVAKMFKFSAYWFKKEHILIRHIAVKESYTRACKIFMSKIFQRRIDLNIPNLIKPPWKNMSVQNFTEKLLYTWKVIFIKEIIK